MVNTQPSEKYTHCVKVRGLRRTTESRDKRCPGVSTRSTFAVSAGSCSVVGAAAGRSLYYLKVSLAPSLHQRVPDIPTELVRATIYIEHDKDDTGDYIVMRQVDAVVSYLAADLMGRPVTIAPSPDQQAGLFWLVENRARKYDWNPNAQ
jgi:hypothetical protein